MLKLHFHHELSMKTKENIMLKFEPIKVLKYKGYKLVKHTLNIVELVFDEGFEGELEHAIEFVFNIAKLRDNEQPVLLLIVYAPDNIFSKEARQYVASSKDSNLVVKAEALIINSLGLRLMGNFYLKINKPPRPAKLFNDRLQGIDWLLDI